MQLFSGLDDLFICVIKSRTFSFCSRSRCFLCSLGLHYFQHSSYLKDGDQLLVRVTMRPGFLATEKWYHGEAMPT